MWFLLSFVFTSDQDWLSKLMILLLVAILSRLSLVVLLWITLVFCVSLPLFEWKVVWNKWNITHWLTNLLLLLLTLWTWILTPFHASFCCSVRWWIIVAYLCCVRNWFTLDEFLLGLRINLIFHCIILLLRKPTIHLSLYGHRVALLSIDWGVFASCCGCSAYWVYLSHLDHGCLDLERLLGGGNVIHGVCCYLLLINTLWWIMLPLIQCCIWLVCVQVWPRAVYNICLVVFESTLSDLWVVVSTHCFVLVWMKSAKLTVWTCLSCWEEHWVQIVKMHLLKLREMHLIWTSCQVWLLCVLMLSSTLDSHERC